MTAPGRPSAKPHGWAWLTLALSLAVHVIDEAAHDFLSVYNPAVFTIRERVPWLPLPVFQFGEWITGLAAAVLLLLVLSRWAFAGARWLVWASFPLGALMLLNGLGHVAASLYTRSWMPGVYSSPLLIASSLWLLRTAARRIKAPAYPG
ncbi:MAG: HXXEE domain-containing protein [Acidobacteriota bacterium]